MQFLVGIKGPVALKPVSVRSDSDAVPGRETLNPFVKGHDLVIEHSYEIVANHSFIELSRDLRQGEQSTNFRPEDKYFVRKVIIERSVP